jgi:hypothetical protein
MLTRSPQVAALLAAASLLAATTPASAAAPSHVWSKSFGTSGSASRGYGVATDASMNVIIVGSFSGTVNFGGVGLVAQGTDVVLAKYNSAGVHLWSKRFGGTAADQGYAVALDPSGNIFIAGYYQGTANFGGTNLTASGTSDIFIAEYNAAGAHQWSRSLGTPDSDIAYSVAADDLGNAILTGYLHGVEPSDIVIAKYDSAGMIAWMKALGSHDGYDEGLSVATDGAGNILVTGSFSGTVDFGGGDLSTPGDDYDVFVAKYAPNGDHVWSKRFGSTDLESGQAIKTDASGNVIVTGYFMGTVDFGGAAPLVSLGTDVDIFLAEYDPAGAHLWSKRLGGTSYETGYGLAVDAYSNVFLTGYFEGAVNFGGVELVSTGNLDIFFAEYSSLGVHLSSQHFGGSATEVGQAIAVDAAGNRYLAGYFGGSVNFGGGPLNSVGTPDMFLAKFAQIASAADRDPMLDGLAISAAPNPFNPSTAINYRLPSSGRVAINVYDVRGRLVETLVDEDESAGAHTVRWDGRNRDGQLVTSGVYFAHISHAGRTRTHKLLLLK